MEPFLNHKVNFTTYLLLNFLPIEYLEFNYVFSEVLKKKLIAFCFV